MKIDTEKLKILQIKENLSNKELIKKAKINPATFYNAKKNKSVPRIETLYKLSKALKVDISELLQEN